jgi:hypothetical protein
MRNKIPSNPLAQYIPSIYSAFFPFREVRRSRFIGVVVRPWEKYK